MQRRTVTALAVLGLVGLAAACQPVTPPPPPPPPSTTSCQAPPDEDHDGKLEYFAVVDDGSGTDEAVPFEAASESEKQAEVAEIEATEGDVVAVEFDYPVQAQVIDDPVYSGTNPGPQWGIDAAGFEQAWTSAGSQGAGAVVAILDTGVHAAHEDLNGATVPGADFIDGATVDGRDDPHTVSHGTHVAGIAGARDNTLGGIGGAPGTTIMSVRVLNAAGSGSYSEVIQGINYAAANGAEVISMSLGGSGYSQALQDAVSAAVAGGTVVIAAAGNTGSCTAHYPAALDGVIAVAATQQSPADSLASFSERGSWVDIAAPGATIWSTLNEATQGGVKYGSKSGTSMSTPFASAAAALLVAKCGSTWGTGTPAQVESRLQSTSAPISGTPIESGALRASAAAALAC
jgi:thermitase